MRYPFGLVVKVMDGMYGPIRLRIVLAERGDRNPESIPTLVTEWPISPKSRLTIGKDESDTGWTVLEPSLSEGELLETCVTVFERTVVRESVVTVSIAFGIEIQVGDTNPTIIEYERDDAQEWRDLIE